MPASDCFPGTMNMASCRSMSRCWYALLLTFTCTSTVCSETAELVLSVHNAAEAKQGVAVDEQFLYVISNHAIAKYDKQTFASVRRWSCPKGEPLIHLNAGIVHDGKLFCAHSNYPSTPMTSSVEIWDTDTLKHIGNHSFGVTDGSLTWIDKRGDNWFACFAHYRSSVPDRDPSWTRLIKFDQEWRQLESWVFPPEVINEFGSYSSSGGAFGPDDRLYVTGHDQPKLYILELPSAGSVLQYAGSISIHAAGQAFDFDGTDPWRMYSISRSQRQVIVSQLCDVDTAR